MHIDFLGHSEYIIEIENKSGHPVRILFDSWLSDFATGDFMARYPRLTIDWQRFPQLNAIFLTHPHCDHFDPYTLTELYRHQRPAILLPETSLFLRPLLDQYLDQPEIFVLRSGEEVSLFGVTLCGFHFRNHHHTNEEDAMQLILHNRREILFYEADTAVPYDIEAWHQIYDHFTAHPFENRIYLATRNELPLLFAINEEREPAQRQLIVEEYLEMRQQEMLNDYLRFEGPEEGYVEEGFARFESLPEKNRASMHSERDLWRLPGIVRIHGGQGIVYAREIEPDRLRLAAPFPLDQVAAMEREIACGVGRGLPIVAQRPGERGVFVDGLVFNFERLDYLNADCDDLTFDANVEIQGEMVDAPVEDQPRDSTAQKEKIERYLNCRLLPFWLMSLETPLKERLLEQPDRSYWIKILYGHSSDYAPCYYRYSFADLAFTEQDPALLAGRKTDERWWANDIEDLLEGRQDLFSTTLHHFKRENIELWNASGYPLLNSDLVYRKIALHFERAAAGESVESFVLPTLKRRYLKP